MVRIFDLGTDQPIQINNDKDQDVNNYDKAGLTVNSNDLTVIINETKDGSTTVILSEFYQEIALPFETKPSVREVVDTIQEYIDNVSPPSPTQEETTLTEIKEAVDISNKNELKDKDIQRQS